MEHGGEGSHGGGVGADPSRAELVLQRIDRLPTLSPVATRLLSMGSAEDADLDEIVVLLESDPALSATMLALCRRADKGLGDRITTVRRAVVMLGLEAVRSVALSVQVYEMFSPGGEGAEPGHEEVRRELWKHALGVACASELLAREARRAGLTPDAAFCCGMLHDIGRIALDLELPRAMARVRELAEQRACDAAAVERAVLGIDQHTAGRRLAERWDLPSSVRDVVWMHSQPAAALPESVDKPMVMLVTAARVWARSMHLGQSGDFGRVPALAPLADAVGLNRSCFDRLGGALADEFAARCELLGLDTRGGHELLLEAITNANKSLSRLNATLERRAERADRLASVLDALSSFHAGLRPGGSVADALGRVVRCAGQLIGEGYYAALYQPEVGTSWRWMRFGPGGLLEASALVDPPPGVSLLGGVGAGEGAGVPVRSALPWLGEQLPEGEIPAGARACPVNPTHGEEIEGPGAVLIHDRGPTGLGAQGWAAVRSAWWSALAGAARGERATRLEEALATANRALAEAQETITRKESMARLGEMSAGAAHEMNNPLTVIRGRAQMLAERLDQPGDIAVARAIQEAAGSLAELIRSLHLLATPPTPEPEAVDLTLVAYRALELAKERWPKVVDPSRVRVEAMPDMPTAWADFELAASALAEGIVNACQVDPGGNVRVLVQRERWDGRLEVRVVDHGPGLSERGLRHAFDPFFSERPAGRSPGLGLPRARSLVELFGGRMDIDNNGSQGGAVLKITFEPARSDERAKAA